ncbi:tetraspanin-13-like isoform X2 [Photinus pyralis]|uniref:tetraspanin-13-like isoform X2 n=1 Tax=Photinus pyralis TaxID=7054 RepID=UPI00126746E8|nr:tetraspanin-13-like isoform X2 [Photinus pyralis]XP_031357817.1 tetraspanin-13-like isoform X2 [Photinus pyralis]
MCGGFTCSKNALISLNILYILVSFILIGVAVYGRAASLVTNLPIVGGILACGVILFLISLLGLVGAVKHHQVMLFFYMVILFLLFLIQFSVACACLGVNMEQQEQLAEQGWEKMDNNTRMEVQQAFGCCGFDEKSTDNRKMDHPSCDALKCCANPEKSCHCSSCMNKWQTTINYAFKLCGWIGLFFSFTEFLGVWLTVRYRNQKDPRANPSAFL